MRFRFSPAQEHKLDKIELWLSAQDPSINYNKALKQRKNKDSGHWFLQSKAFDKWKTRPNSFLWLHASPDVARRFSAPLSLRISAELPSTLNPSFISILL